MKTSRSKTTNGGKTVILESLDEAVALGRKYIAAQIEKFQLQGDTGGRIQVEIVQRDRPTQRKTGRRGSHFADLKRRQTAFEECVQAISTGDANDKREIMDHCERLVELVTAIEPSLAGHYEGFKRSEDGVVADAGLIAAGDDRPCFERKAADGSIAQRRGGKAYRVVLSTDLTWLGKPEDNVTLVGALIMVLQQFGPVELWIQQGWLGPMTNDGVTLFKLDYPLGFEPSQLAFWCGHPLKDDAFSFEINMALGRDSAGSAKSSELPADLFLRGDWMKVYGFDEGFDRMLYTEKLDLMTGWIAETAMKIVERGDDWSDSMHLDA